MLKHTSLNKKLNVTLYHSSLNELRTSDLEFYQASLGALNQLELEVWVDRFKEKLPY